MRALIKSYRFEPENQRIYLGDEFLKKHETINIEMFLIITNITTGDTIYQFNDPELGGTYTYDYLILNLVSDVIH